MNKLDSNNEKNNSDIIKKKKEKGKLVANNNNINNNENKNREEKDKNTDHGIGSPKKIPFKSKINEESNTSSIKDISDISSPLIKSDSMEYNIDSKDKMILDSYKNLGKSTNDMKESNSLNKFMNSNNSEITLPSLVDSHGKGLHDNITLNNINTAMSIGMKNDNALKMTDEKSSLLDKQLGEREITKINNDYSIGINGNLSLTTSSTNNNNNTNNNYNNSTIVEDNHSYASNSPINMVSDQTSKRIDRILEYLKSVGNNSFEMINDTMTDKASVKSDFDLLDSVSKCNGSSSVSGTVINSKFSDTASIYSLYKEKKDNTVEVFDGVKSKIITQQMEIEEKTRSLDFLKKELKKLKDALKDQTTQYRKDIKSKLSLQRKEYETIIKRHLSFVDKLLNEKEQLTTKCQNLGDDVKNMEKMYKQKIKELEEHHTKDIKQQKEIWQASEKIKRDKWIQTKEKQIKDNTIKGLEPEIQKMLSQHKLQIKQLEESYQEKLIKEKQTILDQHQHQMEQLRDKISSERQRACEEEREFSRQRYMKQLERDEMEFQQNKRKLIMEMEEEKSIIINQLKQEKKKEEESLLKEIDELKKKISDLKLKNEESISELNRKNMKE
eukprot:jgi/Orpsp1_1/1180953/evm.model.c7180000075223.1